MAVWAVSRGKTRRERSRMCVFNVLPKRGLSGRKWRFVLLKNNKSLPTNNKQRSDAGASGASISCVSCTIRGQIYEEFLNLPNICPTFSPFFCPINTLILPKTLMFFAHSPIVLPIKPIVFSIDFLPIEPIDLLTILFLPIEPIVLPIEPIDLSIYR